MNSGGIFYMYNAKNTGILINVFTIQPKYFKVRGGLACA